MTYEKEIESSFENTLTNENYINLQIVEKINRKFFKICEKGDISKVIKMLNKKLSKDRRPDLNNKFLHNYTVLHISITNRIILYKFRTI